MDLAQLWWFTPEEIYERKGWTKNSTLIDMIPSHALAFFQEYMQMPKFQDRLMVDCSQNPGNE